MSFLESVPAIRRIETTRPDLFAVNIVGLVTPADAENLFGLLEAAYALHPRIDVLVRLPEYESTDWAGIASDTIENGKTRATEHVGRCASIGNPDWTAGMKGLVASPTTIEVKHFSVDEEEAAWRWLGARPLENP